MVISVQNLQNINVPVTYLTFPTNIGASTLPVKALNQFNASWAIQVGETAGAQTEIVLLSASTPAGTVGTITGTTLFAHPTDLPVYGIKYDQIVFERSTAGTLGTATPMTNGTVTIQANGTATIFDDTSGSSVYAYRTYFRNSVTNQTSLESDWITSSGYPPFSLASIRNRIKQKLFDASFIPSDDVYNAWINEWVEMMTNAAIEINQDYSLGSTQVAFPGTADMGTITATDYKQPRRIWMNTGVSSMQEAAVVRVNDFDPNTVWDQYNPIVYFLGDSVMGRKPNTSGGTANILYYKMTPVLVEDTDTLPVSLQGYSKSFVDYGLAQAYAKDNRFNESAQAEQNAMAQLNRFKMDMMPRNLAGQTYAVIQETISSDSDYWW